MCFNYNTAKFWEPRCFNRCQTSLSSPWWILLKIMPGDDQNIKRRNLVHCQNRWKVSEESILERLQGYVLVSADKACSNIVFVWNTHYYECLLLAVTLRLEILLILQLHHQKIKFFKLCFRFNTFDIPVNEWDDVELPHIFWISRLHRNPYKDTLLDPVNVLAIKPKVYLCSNKNDNRWRRKVPMYCSIIHMPV
jgi:hypothetical protein